MARRCISKKQMKKIKKIRKIRMALPINSIGQNKLCELDDGYFADTEDNVLCRMQPHTLMKINRTLMKINRTLMKIKL